MTEHYAFAASNKVRITAELSVIELMREWKRKGLDLYHNLDGNRLHLYGDRSFKVTDPETGEDRTEEFLRSLSEYLDGKFVVQSVEYEAYEGLPRAEQWVVEQDGTVSYGTLSFEDAVTD